MTLAQHEFGKTIEKKFIIPKYSVSRRDIIQVSSSMDKIPYATYSVMVLDNRSQLILIRMSSFPNFDVINCR